MKLLFKGLQFLLEQRITNTMKKMGANCGRKKSDKAKS